MSIFIPNKLKKEFHAGSKARAHITKGTSKMWFEAPGYGGKLAVTEITRHPSGSICIDCGAGSRLEMSAVDADALLTFLLKSKED